MDITISSPVQTFTGLLGISGKSSQERVDNAAREFEALLLAQILKSATSLNSGLLGDEEDQAGGHAMQYALEELGRAIASTGGLGLSKLVVRGLQTRGPNGDSEDAVRP